MPNTEKFPMPAVTNYAVQSEAAEGYARLSDALSKVDAGERLSSIVRTARSLVIQGRKIEAMLYLSGAQDLAKSMGRTLEASQIGAMRELIRGGNHD